MDSFCTCANTFHHVKDKRCGNISRCRHSPFSKLLSYVCKLSSVCSGVCLAGLVPALSAPSELALSGAARVVVEVEQAGVTVLPLLHPGVPTHLAVPLLEAHWSLEAERLPYGGLAAV